MSLSISVPITVGSHEYVQRLASLFAAAFTSDPLERAGILYQDSIPNDRVISQGRWFKHWDENIKIKIDAGGQIVEAGDWAAAALWFPPGVIRPPLGNRDELPTVFLEYFDKFENLKKRYLGEQRYWYLNLIGRHPDRREPGIVRALVEPYLQLAQEERIPVFLEASNTHARDVYIHFGFRTVEEVVVGEGHIDEEGSILIGGKGVILYAMIAEPSTQ